jgi:hypothetical protein
MEYKDMTIDVDLSYNYPESYLTTDIFKITYRKKEYNIRAKRNIFSEGTPYTDIIESALQIIHQREGLAWNYKQLDNLHTSRGISREMYEREFLKEGQWIETLMRIKSNWIELYFIHNS